MKKLLFILTLCLAGTAQAQHRYYHHHHSGGPGWGWVVPAVIGGAVVYGVTRPNPPPPPPTVIYVPQGYPPAPPGFHYEQLLDANCNCYRWVLVQG
jgi:hypothetical protein